MLVRMGAINISPSWILTEYNNQSSPFTFYTIGSEQTFAPQSGGASSSVDLVLNNGVTFQRSFFVSDVYRDGNGYVTSTQSVNFYDPSTKLITVKVSVASSSVAPGIYSMYFTRSGNNYVSQATWSGGQNSTPTKFMNNLHASDLNVGTNGAGALQLSANATSGTLDAQPFDTGLTSGAQVNSFIWQGSQPANTTVLFQFAASNSSGGPWSFVGPDGTNNTYFSGNPGTPVNLISTTNGYALFNGYRYFTYRAFLSSISTTTTPIVSVISVNWSP